MIFNKINVAILVIINPPIKPSHVLFGDIEGKILFFREFSS